jgi:hypothetical protein
MRIERTSYPWESEDADPRLELRRRAAESQRGLDGEDDVFDDLRSTDWEDWGLTDERRGDPVPPVTSRG